MRRKRCIRESGKIVIGLRYKLDESSTCDINLNSDLWRRLRVVEQSVLDIVHEGQTLSVSEILSWPGVITDQPKDLSPLINIALSSFCRL